ncbi:WecB/TagA/CpsF family glycosyltransferase [Cryobacterium sp. SO2]|uniref:WecB/TagA/CpsF family glycosyltransferase n=1 Tax=Cryobacterium sp. SO2 TaxID=1897060 RepID=UPI00223DB075|nr:WecB/TagA/CpsF family glycosyltransferase [Cryobacterium sp. SO2]WEO76919.1 WecB/TagA/CpsF family glycosyltransferase [Cryobacterium sp. SO2]
MSHDSTTDHSRDTHSARQPLFGLEIDALTMGEVLDRAQHGTEEHLRFLIGVVNAAKIVKMRTDTQLRSSLLEADVLLADGQSVVWASRILGHPLPERIAGIDLFERLLEAANRERRSVYFLGARREVLDQLLERVRMRYPRLIVAGSRDGYFADSEAAGIAATIAHSRADMLFLGISSPKKENFLARYGAELNVPLLHGVGGSFDVLAGVTRRAPERWQRLGFEWAYRLLQEPGRLWNRYLFTNTAFIALTLRERIHPTTTYTVNGPTTAQRTETGDPEDG